MYRVFLGLGSNIGDRIQHLKHALSELGHIALVKAISPVYQTEPYGMSSQHEFLNSAVEIETSLEPPELLHKLKNLEKKLGRSPHTHMKDREIDIDILLYNNYYYEEHLGHTIEVPHPDLTTRKFALAPLNDIASTLMHPVFGETIGTLLQQCPDKNKVIKTSLKL